MSEIIKSNYYEIIDGTTMYNEDYVEQLHQEIKELKHKLEDEIECKEIAQGHKENIQINEAYERKEKEKYKNILTEFEKWLEEKIKCTEQYADNDMAKGYINAIKLCKYYLQELKEGKK